MEKDSQSPLRIRVQGCRQMVYRNGTVVKSRTDGVSLMTPCSREKLLSVEVNLSVPQTDTGELVEYTKVFERSQAKELCNLLP